MRIGIDIRRAGGFGVGTYTKNLVRSLSRVGSGHEFVLIGRPEHRQHFGELPANFSFEAYDRRYDAPRSHVTYGFALRRLGLDTLHVPHRWVPLSAPRPYVSTLHDLNNILFPAAEESKFKQNLSISALRRGLMRAAKVITVSNATKQDAVKRLGLAESKLEVV
jgi:glycosyltransferase involved in cell wall biosynthesis